MDLPAVRAAADRQLRRDVQPSGGATVERDGAVTRVIGAGWSGVVWSDLTTADADAVIRREITRFGATSWEWKHYSGDQPEDLGRRLRDAGFVSDPPETVMVAELAELDLSVPPPDGVRIDAVTTAADVEELVRLHDLVFGGEHASVGVEVSASLGAAEPACVAFLARAGDVVVSAGRVEFHADTEFASIWGGGTLPDWRGRGIFRAQVARRAALAQDRGFHYLQVDAMPASRPILERVGFTETATTTPYRYVGRA